MQDSKQLSEVMVYAESSARSRKINLLYAHHILYAMSKVENEASKYMEQFGLTSQNLDSREMGKGGMPRYSDELELILFHAQNFAKAMNQSEYNCIHVLLAILARPDTYAYGKIKYVLERKNSAPQQLYEAIVSDLDQKEKFLQYVSAPDYAGIALGGKKQPQISSEKSSEKGDSKAKGGAAAQRPLAEVMQGRAQSDTSAYVPYSVDLTEKAMLGELDPVIGRERETERVIQTLTRRTKNNPVLVGEAGVGKTAVVEGLASAIAKGEVPAELQAKRLVELDIAAIVAGTRFRGDFEERLTNVINQVISQGDVILFIDEIHNLVGAGASSEGTMGASEILKPMLARGELQVIGATTTKEYRQYIEKDPALERRFQPISVEEPAPDVAVKILKGVKYKYENHHGVIITDAAIEEAVHLSIRYVTDRRLPDKAFDIIDEACSKLKISAFAVPPRLVELSSQLQSLKRKMDSASLSAANSPQYQSWKKMYDECTFEYEYLQEEYKMQLKDYKCKLTPNDVRLVVSQMTGVPVSELSVAERDKLVHLEEELSKRVIGQKQAVQAVARAVRRQRAGLKDPNRPIGSFIFVGPTGVGKTELAKALSQCLFGVNNEVIRIDMSEYMDKQSTAKLIGAPPGYVGYDEGGYLTDKVLSKPYSVVLFDEIEKAHPDVFNLLLQILDEGRLTDSHGKTVDFRNTVIIMTSNAGVTDGVSRGIGFGARDDFSEMKNNVESALRKTFRPEFLNRLDEIIVFSYLSEQETFDIAKMLCLSLHKRLRGTLSLQFTDRAVREIASKGYDKEYGARPLKRAIQREIEDPLAEQLLKGEISTGDAVLVDSNSNGITFKKIK